MPLLKDVPTLAESGLKDFKFTTWSGLMVPAATPNFIVERLATEMQKITASAAFREKLADMGLEAGGPVLAQYKAFLKDDMTNWSHMVKASGAKLD